MDKLAGPFGTMPQECWHDGKGAKLDGIIQLNCRDFMGELQPRKKMILL